MSETELALDTHRIAQPCVLLKRAGSPDRLAGVWGGPGVIRVRPGSFRHWLSLDCCLL